MPVVMRPPRLVPLITRRDLPEPLLVGALGGVFNFRIFVCLTWTSERLDKRAFETAIGEHTVDIQNRVLEFAREVAGDHPPHDVAEVQKGINNLLPPSFSPFAIGNGGVLKCQARIRVAPDKRLEDRLAEHEERLIDVENEHQLRKQRTKLMHDLATEWIAMVCLLRDHPMTAHASRLTDDDFADIIANMTEKRGDKTERLIRLLKL